MREILWLLLLLITIDMRGQQLKIGDHLPASRFESVVNYTSPMLDTKDMQGKMVLYDFWATWCGSCVASMPKMAALEKKFGGELEVVLISYQTKEEVNKFYEKRPAFKALGLPIVTNDSLMLERFPCRMIPHVVWVGKDGIVKAITRGDFVTDSNVAILSKMNFIDLPLKQDAVAFDYTEPFSKSPMMREQPVMLQSHLTGYVEGLASRNGFNQLDSVHTLLHATNGPLLGLIYTAIEHRFQPVGRQLTQFAVLETRHTDLLKYVTQLSDREQQCFCYEAIMPLPDGISTRRALKAKMLHDLEDAFGIDVTIEERRQPCYVLSPMTEGKLQPIVSEQQIATDEKLVKLGNYQNLVADLVLAFHTPIPIVYEGDQQQLFTVVLKKQYDNLAVLQADLYNAGLQLTTSERQLIMLVIKDRNNQPE